MLEEAFEKTAEFFLKHSLFRSCRTGQVPSAQGVFLKDKLSQGMTPTETEKTWKEKGNGGSASQTHVLAVWIGWTCIVLPTGIMTFYKR